MDTTKRQWEIRVGTLYGPKSEVKTQGHTQELIMFVGDGPVQEPVRTGDRIIYKISRIPEVILCGIGQKEPFLI